MSNPGSDADDFDRRLYQEQLAAQGSKADLTLLVREYLKALDAFKAMFTSGGGHDGWEILEQAKNYAERQLRAAVAPAKDKDSGVNWDRGIL